jgi:hypothetical protein
VKRYEVLEKLVKEHDWRRGAEIGVHRGRTFLHLLKSCNKLELIGVDTWGWDEEQFLNDPETGVSASRLRSDMEHFARTVKQRAMKSGRGTIHHMASVEAAPFVPDASLDFVFIDAEHTTEHVLADIAAWKPKVKPGGWLMGHDCHWPAVQRALTQALGAWEVHPDNVWSVPQ